ncbi:aldehyde-activating protein [Thalassotalea sp. 42_200_T64]|nr:aldehyde-activating protein [Thalassotalea sp. 42_200_T64]
MKSYKGGCHCGVVKFGIIADIKSVIKCNCSICTKKGALLFKVKPDNFNLVSGKGNLTLYTFNTKIAKHLFCDVCGIHCFHHPRSTPDLIAINVNCLDEELDFSSVEIIHFDGKNWDKDNLHKIGVTKEPIK